MENNNEYILALLAAGLSVIPITEGGKNPHSILGSTHDLLKRRATLEEAGKWITEGVNSWALASGKVSGNLITLDFDEKHYQGLYDLFYAKLSEEQKVTVDACYRNRTRNNGTHLRYRTETTKSTEKLASRVEVDKETGKEKIVTTAETRGEGSYALIPPSAGYITLGGSIRELPIVSEEIHNELIDILRTFNEVEDEPETEYEWKESDTQKGDRPGDRLNKKISWKELLEPHNWVEEEKHRWRRPGKNTGEGISATTDYDGRPMFYVFSSSASPFKENRGYSKFSVFTLLNHNGDYKAAAKAAAEIYPTEQKKDERETEVTIEEIEVMLNQIPSETPTVKLMQTLAPIFLMLTKIERITAEAFITNNIKDYFKISKEDAKKFIPNVNYGRLQLLKEERGRKNNEGKRPIITDRDIDFGEAYESVLEIGIVSKETFEIITAVIISSQLRLNPPLWLFFIGVPSSFKTELIGLYSDMKEVYTLDTLTENAFASGYVPPDGSDPQDLLPELDNKAFTIKDLNTLFSMNQEMVKKILGDLTSIFDGKFEKFTATRGMVAYNSLFSMIGCVTPSILTKHYNYTTQLGPRFFFLRLPELSDEELQNGLNKSWNDLGRKEKILESRQIVSSYCTQQIKNLKEYQWGKETKEIKDKINRIALFICKARGIATTTESHFKNEEGHEISYYDVKDWQVEQPWRILSQLKSLLRVISFIHHKDQIGKEEIKTIRGIVISTMPVDRAEVLSHLTVKSGLSTKDLSVKIHKSYKTIGRTLKALEALGIIDYYKDPRQYTSSKAPKLFFILEEFATVLEAPIPSPDLLEFRKSKIGEDESTDKDYDEVEDEKISSSPEIKSESDLKKDMPF